MFWFFQLLTFVWRHRYRLLLPTILLPIFILAWQLSRPHVYTATATLQLNTGNASSPLLSHLTQPGNEGMLRQVLTSSNVLQDTMAETGAQIDPSHLDLKNLDNRLFQLIYRSPTRAGLEETVDTLALNFIHEILAPERFRTEQQVQSLEDKIREYSEGLEKTKNTLKTLKQDYNLSRADQMKAYQQRKDALLFQRDRLETQLKLVQKDYETMLVSLRSLVPHATNDTATDTLWFAEPTIVFNPAQDATTYTTPLSSAAYLGLILGIFLILFHKLTDHSLRREDDVTKSTGVRVLGRLPAMGHLQIGRDEITVDPSAEPMTNKGASA